MQFSVIIPAKNEAAHIGRCLDSLSRTDWDPGQYEVFVVDNGSTDPTVALARERGATVLEAPHLSIAGLRNLGAARASGEILAFLDADCAVDSAWFSAASRYLGGASDVVCFGSPALVPEGGTWVQRAWFNVRGKPGQIVEVDWLESANLLVRRSAFERIGGFDQRLVTCEDYDLTTRLKALGRVVSDCRVVATHFREPATLGEFVKKEMWRSKSNYRGILRRRVARQELPSLVLPVACLALCLMAPLLLFCYLFGLGQGFLWGFLLLLLSWELPLLWASLKKNRSRDAAGSLQLLVLLNAYFLARGCALMSGGCGATAREPA